MTDPKNGPAFGRGVKTRIAANVAIISALAVILAAFANFGAHRLAKSRSLRFDLTREGTYTLDASTRQVVADLDVDVDIYCLTAEFDDRILAAARPSLQANAPDSGLLERLYRPQLALMRGRLDALLSEAHGLNERLHFTAVDGRVDRDTPMKWRRELELDARELVNHLVFRNRVTGAKRSFDLFRVFDVRLGGPGALGHVPPEVRGDHIDAFVVAGIRAVTQGERKTVGFAIGHGEEHLPAAQAVMQAEGIDVRPVDLGRVAEIDADIDLVMVSSPTREWRPEARRALLDWVERGGSVLITQGRLAQEDHAELLGSFGIVPLSVQVAHPRQHEISRGEFELRGADFLVPAEGRSAHPVTELLATDRLPVYLGFSRAFRFTPDATAGLTRDAILHSGPDARAVAWVFGRGGWRQAPDRETIRGEDLALAVAARRELDLSARDGVVPEARLVCFGGEEWLSAQNLNLGYNLANRDLLRSTVNWLLGRERMITKTPRVYTRHLARLEEDDLKTFSALTIWILPALVFLAGLLVFLVRRRA